MNSISAKINYDRLNMAAYIAMVAINILANTLPLGGYTSGQISDRYQTLFTPAGFTFSIWGVIYLMLGIVLIRQLLGKGRNGHILTYEVKGLFTLSCILNIAWILCWHFGQITGAALVIFALLINLVVIMAFVKEDILMSLAFGIYTAWITVASVASLFVTAAYYGYNVISPSGEIYAMIALIFSGAVLSLITVFSQNISFAAVGVWSFAGIIVRHSETFNSQYRMVTRTAIIMTVVLIAGIATGFLQNIGRWESAATTGKDKKPAISGQSF